MYIYIYIYIWIIFRGTTVVTMCLGGGVHVCLVGEGVGVMHWLTCFTLLLMFRSKILKAVK